jgi:hypothetical protein
MTKNEVGRDGVILMGGSSCSLVARNGLVQLCSSLSAAGVARSLPGAAIGTVCALIISWLGVSVKGLGGSGKAKGPGNRGDDGKPACEGGSAENTKAVDSEEVVNVAGLGDGISVVLGDWQERCPSSIGLMLSGAAAVGEDE